MQRVLLLGPDDDARRSLHMMLDRAGMQVSALAELEAAATWLAGHPCDAVIADGALAPAVIALVKGKARVISMVKTREEINESPHAAAVSLVGDGAAMTELRAQIDRIAVARSTVLIHGESGTGKELVARAIHQASPRRDMRFVAINCAAIPEALLESELFGHVRGAFTDAVRDKAGLFEEADGGTLFLDEVGEMPMPLQAKLLRVLQEGEIRRVGDEHTIKVDVRLIAATLRDLEHAIASGAFREDLYYRLAVVPITVPPLRDRREDIPQLARFFVGRHAERHARGSVTLTEAAIAALREQPWAGNVRELENVLERALVLVDGNVIDLPFLSTVMNVRAAQLPTSVPDELSIKKATRDLEAKLIERALGVTSGNRTNAAKLLEISHRALLYKMKEYGIS